MASVRVNDVYETLEGESARFVRLLWVDRRLDNVTFLPLGASARPISVPGREFRRKIADREMRWTDDHAFDWPLFVQPFSNQPSIKNTDKFAVTTGPKNASNYRTGEQKLLDDHRRLIQPLMVAAENGTLYDDYIGLITRRAKETGASGQTVERVLQRWLEYGMVEPALGTMRHRCGGRGKERIWSAKSGPRKSDTPTGVPLNAEVRAAFEWSVDWLRREQNLTRPKFDGYIAMNDRFFSLSSHMVGEVERPRWLDPHLRPTERQFYNYVRRKLPHKKRVQAVRGSRNYKLNVSPILGSTSGWSHKPGSITHIDSSPMAIKIVDRATRSTILGQPRTFFVMDEFSTVLTGSFSTLENGETAEDAAIAIADSLTGTIKGPRPRNGSEQSRSIRKFMYQELFSDKGAAYLSKLIENHLSRMRGWGANPPGGAANQRGKGEKIFDICNKLTAWLPGAIQKRFRGRGDVKRGGDACLTMSEYDAVIAEFIRHHNNTSRPIGPPESMLPGMRKRTAFELLEWGIANIGSPRAPNAQEVILCLLEPVAGTIDQNGYGLVIDGARYVLPGRVPGTDESRHVADLNRHNSETGFDLSRSGGRHKGTWLVLRDRRRLGSVLLLSKHGGQPIELVLDADHAPYAELTVAEWRKINSAGRASEREDRENFLVQRGTTTAVLQGIAAGALATEVKARQGKNTKGLRKVESEHQRAAVFQNAEPSRPVAPVRRRQVQTPVNDDEDSTDMFRTIRDEMKQVKEQ
jgi:hypothetical protein